MRTVLLSTDLYHKHADPNDHWNLATMFALARQGWIRFAGVLCDDDRTIKEDGSYLHFGDPAVQAVAQLNWLCGLAVPVGIGSRRPIRCEEDVRAALSGRPISYVALILETLQNAVDPVDIHVCGSCRDILLALRTAPDLFERKVGHLYLNAGTYAKQEPREYNVSLEPWAYSQLFLAPCKIRWAPCFDELRPWPYRCARRANYYLTQQRDLVPALSPAMKKFFNYMAGPIFDKGWLSYLREPVDEALLASWVGAEREMWSTPGYLLSAGKNVARDGSLVAGDSRDGIFRYRPVAVSCAPDGDIAWKDVSDSNVEMFENDGPDIYQAAMPVALRALLSTLPDGN